MHFGHDARRLVHRSLHGNKPKLWPLPLPSRNRHVRRHTKDDAAEIGGSGFARSLPFALGFGTLAKLAFVFRDVGFEVSAFCLFHSPIPPFSHSPILPFPTTSPGSRCQGVLNSADPSLVDAEIAVANPTGTAQMQRRLALEGLNLDDDIVFENEGVVHGV